MILLNAALMIAGLSYVLYVVVYGVEFDKCESPGYRATLLVIGLDVLALTFFMFYIWVLDFNGLLSYG